MKKLNEDLIIAVVAHDLEQVKLLVDNGADINFINQWNNSALFTAAWDGNIEALDLYYLLGAELESSSNSPFCNAAYNGKVESVKWFIARGVNINFSFEDTGENALHYTICKTSEMTERTEITKALIDAGIDVNKKTNKGIPTLCFMRDALLKAETPLHRAAAYGNTQMIKLLLAAGAKSDVKDGNGDTPISWGSWHLRDSDILRLLVYGDVRIN